MNKKFKLKIKPEISRTTIFDAQLLAKVMAKRPIANKSCTSMQKIPMSNDDISPSCDRLTHKDAWKGTEDHALEVKGSKKIKHKRIDIDIAHRKRSVFLSSKKFKELHKGMFESTAATFKKQSWRLYSERSQELYQNESCSKSKLFSPRQELAYSMNSLPRTEFEKSEDLPINVTNLMQVRTTLYKKQSIISKFAVQKKKKLFTTPTLADGFFDEALINEVIEGQKSKLPADAQCHSFRIPSRRASELNTSTGRASIKLNRLNLTSRPQDCYDIMLKRKTVPGVKVIDGFKTLREGVVPANCNFNEYYKSYQEPRASVSSRKLRRMDNLLPDRAKGALQRLMQTALKSDSKENSNAKVRQILSITIGSLLEGILNPDEDSPTRSIRGPPPSNATSPISTNNPSKKFIRQNTLIQPMEVQLHEKKIMNLKREKDLKIEKEIKRLALIKEKELEKKCRAIERRQEYEQKKAVESLLPKEPAVEKKPSMIPALGSIDLSLGIIPVSYRSKLQTKSEFLLPPSQPYPPSFPVIPTLSADVPLHPLLLSRQPELTPNPPHTPDYNSYWLDCITSLLYTDDISRPSNVGYYTWLHITDTHYTPDTYAGVCEAMHRMCVKIEDDCAIDHDILYDVRDDKE